MRARVALAAIAIFVCFASSSTQRLPPPDAWDAADVAVRRLPPSAFVDLPAVLRVELERRGCTIPQSSVARTLENVVRGSFRSAGSSDWAVLCSIDRVSTILVFWNGEPRSVDSFAARPDRRSLMMVTHDRIGFSRGIYAAAPEQIRRYHANHGGPALPPLTHMGINEGLFESASIVWYWHDGRWLKLQGAD